MTSPLDKETPKHGGELSKGRAVAWAFYDWANSAFATTVMAGFFPIFFKQYWAEGVEATESSFWLGAVNSTASLTIALLAPLLGAVADRGSTKKRFLLFFALMGVVMTGSLHFVAQGQWPLAALLYGLAFVGFAGGNIFYDSLIVVVAGEEKLDMVSALGFGLGYLGGGLLFAGNVLMTLNPQWFGLTDATQAVQVAFITVAVWWAVFTVPVLLFVPEVQDPQRLKGLAAVGAGFRQLKGTFREIRRLRMVGLFLLAYWLYIDGVDTVVVMAVDYGLSLGFSSNDLITALLIVQFVGFPAAIAFGKLGERLGAKTGIYIGIVAYTGITVWGYFMDQT